MSSDESTRDFVLYGAWTGTSQDVGGGGFSMRFSQYEIKEESQVLGLIDSIVSLGFVVKELQFEMVGAGQRNAEFTRDFLRQLGERKIRLSIESKALPF